VMAIDVRKVSYRVGSAAHRCHDGDASFRGGSGNEQDCLPRAPGRLGGQLGVEMGG